MIPCVTASINKHIYYPLCNNQAFTRLKDLDNNLLDNISGDTEASFELAFRAFRILTEEGEAVRKFYGYKPGNDLPEWEEAKLIYSPADVVDLKQAVFGAVILGLNREVPDDVEVDLSLLEFQKKTK